MTDFLDEVVLAPYLTAAQLPAHQKGLVVWSTAHGSLIWSDGARWISPRVTGYPFKAFSGDFMDAAPFSCQLSTASVITNGLQLVPFIPRIDFSCDQLDIDVVGPGVNRFYKICVYESDGTDGWLPGTALFIGANLSAGTTGAKTSAVSPVIEFKAGKLYWIGVHNNVGDTNIRGFAVTGISIFQLNSVGGAAGAVTFMSGIRATVTFASGPPTDATSIFSASSRISADMPRIRMRVV